MIKSVCAPLAVGIMLVPQVSLVVANETAPNERAQSVLTKPDWQDKDLSSYLPALSSQPPWLDLDARTKLPKGDFPLGREVTGIGRFICSLSSARKCPRMTEKAPGCGGGCRRENTCCSVLLGPRECGGVRTRDGIA